MKEHICRQIKYCSCMSHALEPDENCMIHNGYYKQPRCSYCGRFLMNNIATDILNAAAKHGYFGAVEHSIEKDGSWLIVKLFSNDNNFTY